MRKGILSPAALGVVGAALCSVCASAGSACPADLNGDGVVNGGDLGTLLAQWGGGGSGDLNGDGVVNGGDLGLMLGAWGDCPGVIIESVTPESGGPGTELLINGSFPSNDPFDYCVVLVETSPAAAGDGQGPVLFAPIQVRDIVQGPAGQVMIADIGPVPEFFEGEVELMIVPGIGGPVELVNFFPNLVDLEDEARWGDPQPGGANIIFNVGSPSTGGACGLVAPDCSHVGSVTAGKICVVLPPGPLAGGNYPAGTMISIWPRFHTCNGMYVSDFGTIKFTLVSMATPGQVAGLIEFFTDQEVQTCGPQNALIPTVDVTPLGGGNFQICMEIAGRAFCAGNFVLCVDFP